MVSGEHACEINYAVTETLELLHPDYSYEFQIGWMLWSLSRTPVPARAGYARGVWFA